MSWMFFSRGRRRAAGSARWWDVNDRTSVAARCGLCGGVSGLRLVNGEFRCRDTVACAVTVYDNTALGIDNRRSFR